MQRHCCHAACTHSGIAASLRSQRQCRQHALVAALPPASTHMQRHCRHSVYSVRGSAAQSESMLQFRFIFMNVLSNKTAIPLMVVYSTHIVVVEFLREDPVEDYQIV
jgi:hypothetical protein